MYKRPTGQFTFENFTQPFGGKLRASNRFVKLAALIPWEELEEQYAGRFSASGAPAKPFHLCLGALLLKQITGVSDRELLEQIGENPYMQYFLGYRRYEVKPPFSLSYFGRIRKRIDPALVAEYSALYLKKAAPKTRKRSAKSAAARKKTEEK